MMNTSQQIRTEIEHAARLLQISPSTLGERCGQGGHFYARLCEGKRVWPETAEKVRKRIQVILSHAGRETSHGDELPVFQGR